MTTNTLGCHYLQIHVAFSNKCATLLLSVTNTTVPLYDNSCLRTHTTKHKFQNYMMAFTNLATHSDSLFMRRWWCTKTTTTAATSTARSSTSKASSLQSNNYINQMSIPPQTEHKIYSYSWILTSYDIWAIKGHLSKNKHHLKSHSQIQKNCIEVKRLRYLLVKKITKQKSEYTQNLFFK